MRKRTIRKIWMPANGITPVERAAYNACKLSAEEWNEQVLPVQIAVDALCRGEWEQGNWQNMFEALNRIESLLKIKKAADNGLIKDAQAVFVSALGRRDETGATAFKAAEMKIMREVAQVYGDLLREVTHKDWRDACAHTNANVARIIRAKRGITHVSGCVVEMAA